MIENFLHWFIQKTFQSVSSSNSSVYDERTVDILSALELSQSVLIGSPNVKRILVARLALTMADPKQVFQADQLNKICRLFVSIERLIQFSDILQNLSSESYMYWYEYLFVNGIFHCIKLYINVIISIIFFFCIFISSFQDAILPVYTRHVIDVNEASDCEKIQVKNFIGKCLLSTSRYNDVQFSLNIFSIYSNRLLMVTLI